MWTINCILHETIWKRCRFRFRGNINEPLLSVTAWRSRSFWSVLLHHVTPLDPPRFSDVSVSLVTCLCLLGNRGLCFSCGWRLIHFLPGDLVMARLHVPSPSTVSVVITIKFTFMGRIGSEPNQMVRHHRYNGKLWRWRTWTRRWYDLQRYSQSRQLLSYRPFPKILVAGTTPRGCSPIDGFMDGTVKWCNSTRQSRELWGRQLCEERCKWALNIKISDK